MVLFHFKLKRKNKSFRVLIENLENGSFVKSK